MYIFKQSHTLTFGVKYNKSSCTKKKLIYINNNVFTVTKEKKVTGYEVQPNITLYEIISCNYFQFCRIFIIKHQPV